jgi:hypothetical protein
MSRRSCIVCGRRPHDGAYHETLRARLRRWVNLLDGRYPALRGRGGYPPSDPPARAENRAEKPSKIKGPFRLRHRVSTGPDFLRGLGRARKLAEVPGTGTGAWRRLQEHLALDAPLRPLRGKTLVVGEGQ